MAEQPGTISRHSELAAQSTLLCLWIISALPAGDTGQYSHTFFSYTGNLRQPDTRWSCSQCCLRKRHDPIDWLAGTSASRRSHGGATTSLDVGVAGSGIGGIHSIAIATLALLRRRYYAPLLC